MLRRLKKWIPQDSPVRLAYHALTGWCAALLYGFPARKMTCIGITGTDGKTTTTFLTADLLRLQGIKVGMASTIGFRIGDVYTTNTTHKTTMGRLGLQKLLRAMVRAGCTHAVLEVSSHGLVQSRLAGIPFHVAVITNLSREHLDYHKTMEEYKKAKGKLFQVMAKNKGVAIIGADFPESVYYAQFPARKQTFFGYTTGQAEALAQQTSAHALTARITEVQASGQRIEVQSKGSLYETCTQLAGDFNILNILAALGAGAAVGLSLESLISTVPQLKGVPGRMEEIQTRAGKRVIIDYAVTPEALTKLYSTVRKMTSGKVYAVLGACGDRDQGKRPAMGEIATMLCDHVYITDEETYTEEGSAILAMLEEGAKRVGGENYTVIPDRRSAIETALQKATTQDIVIVSGMGDQTSRIMGGKKEHWSDREEILAAQDS